MDKQYPLMNEQNSATFYSQKRSIQADTLSHVAYQSNQYSSDLRATLGKRTLQNYMSNMQKRSNTSSLTSLNNRIYVDWIYSFHRDCMDTQRKEGNANDITAC